MTGLCPVTEWLMFTPLGLAAIVGCHSPSTSNPAIPAEVRLVSRAAWGAHAPVLPMTRQVPIRITIHHTGTSQNPRRSVEAKMRALQPFSQPDDSLGTGKAKPAWADVPYHHYIAVDGSVAEGREWQYAGDTNTEYNPVGHLLVVVEGSFDSDTLTSAQRRALDAIVPALAHHFHIPDRCSPAIGILRRSIARVEISMPSCRDFASSLRAPSKASSATTALSDAPLILAKLRASPHTSMAASPHRASLSTLTPLP